MADKLDRKHQSRQEDANHEGHPLHGRSEEMFEIVGHAVMFDALPVVVTERTNSAAQGNDWNPSRRFKCRNHAQQVAPQDENAERRQESNKFLAAVADDLVGLRIDKAVEQFGEVLNSSGPVDGQARPDQQEDRKQQYEDHQLHGEGIRDGSLRMLGLDVQHPKEVRDRTREEAV